MKDLFPYRRRLDWSSRWVRFMKDSLDLRAELKLDWREMNCVLWCCMWLEECTGHNPYDEFGAIIRSPSEAAQVIKGRGYDTLDQIVGSYFDEILLSKAQVGDIVLVEAEAAWEAPEEVKSTMPLGAALADPPFYWCVTPSGLAKGDLYAHAVRAFAVGRPG